MLKFKNERLEDIDIVHNKTLDYIQRYNNGEQIAYRQREQSSNRKLKAIIMTAFWALMSIAVAVPIATCESVQIKQVLALLYTGLLFYFACMSMRRLAEIDHLWFVDSKITVRSHDGSPSFFASDDDHVIFDEHDLYERQLLTRIKRKWSTEIVTVRFIDGWWTKKYKLRPGDQMLDFIAFICAVKAIMAGMEINNITEDDIHELTIDTIYQLMLNFKT